MVVDLPIGLMTNGVMMRITTQAATLMVALAVTMALADGAPIVKYIWLNYLNSHSCVCWKEMENILFLFFFAGL